MTQTQMLKTDAPAGGSVLVICASCFGFVSDFEIRASDFPIPASFCGRDGRWAGRVLQ
jgi:hypothetical protein